MSCVLCCGSYIVYSTAAAAAAAPVVVVVVLHATSKINAPISELPGTTYSLRKMKTRAHTRSTLGSLYFAASLKKNQNVPRPSEHPPVREQKCQNV